MVVSRGAPVRRCDMTPCLDESSSSHSPRWTQWLTQLICFSGWRAVAAPALSRQLLMVCRPHSTHLWVDTLLVVTVQSVPTACPLQSKITHQR